jgi:hypothetical protein
MAVCVSVLGRPPTVGSTVAVRVRRHGVGTIRAYAASKQAAAKRVGSNI